LVSDRLPENLARYWDTLTRRPAYQTADAADKNVTA